MNIELSPTGLLSKDFAGYVLSEGTLKTSDLLRKARVFLLELETHFFNSVGVSKESYANFLDTKKLVEDILYNHTTPADTASDVWDSVCVFLNSIAPDGHFFGSHEGDGACFGFWVDEDSDYWKGECKQLERPEPDYIYLHRDLAQDLKKLVNYDFDEEFRHFNECEDKETPTENHIFLSINRIKNFLEENGI